MWTTSKRGRAARPQQKGGALLAVLWMSAALAAIALSLSSTVRSETDRATTNSDGLRAWYLASGSVERGIQWMMWGEGYRNADGSPRFWEPNRPRLPMTYPSGEAIVEMIPESSKLNINLASPGDIQRVITVLTNDPERAAEITRAIIDWRSPGGAGSFAPASTFQPSHASFQEIEELLAVPGVTPELFYGSFTTDAGGRSYPRDGLKDCFSVWGSMGPFDANTASPAVLEAFGVEQAAVEALVERRKIAPIKQSDFGTFGLNGRFSLGGNTIWTLRATARLRHPDGSSSDVVRSAAAVVKLLDRQQYFTNPVHVLRYYQDAWSQFAVAPPQTPAAGGFPAGGASLP
jgi:general secretion pathway protein K